MRDNFVDIAKGLAIIAVIRIHTECAGYMHIPYPVIAVPLFFFLSGFYDRSEKNIREWGLKTFFSLIFTATIWSTVSWLFLSLMASGKNHEWSPIEENYTIYRPFIGRGVTWFLVALFNAKILQWLLSSTFNRIPLSNRWKLALQTVTVLCLGTISSLSNLPLLIDEGMAALPFYFAGKISYPHIKRIIRNKILIFAGIIVLFFMPCKWFPYVLVVFSGTPYYLYPIFFCAILLSFVPTLALCTYTNRCNWLANYGKESLGVLVIHPILLHMTAITLNRLCDKGSLIWCVCFLFAFIIIGILSYLITICIKKYCPIMLGITNR